MDIEQMREAAKYVRTSPLDADDAVPAMTVALGLGFEFCRYLDDSPITAEALEADGWKCRIRSGANPDRSHLKGDDKVTLMPDGAASLTRTDKELLCFSVSAIITTMGALRAATELVR